MPSKLLASFRALGASVYTRVNLYQTSTRYNRYRQMAQGYADRQLLHVDWVIIDPATRPELVERIKRNLPDFVGFKSQVFTYVESEWNNIYGDFDPPRPEGTLIKETVSPGQRGRLLQILEACPEGSYGYYAKFALAPFHAIIGNFAAATIDEFFAANVEYLKQPMSPLVSKILALLETKYWNSREDVVEFAAGQILNEHGRELAMDITSKVIQLWEGGRVPDLPDSETLDEQLPLIVSQLSAGISEMDYEVSQRIAQELYEKAVRNNIIKLEGAAESIDDCN
ncbi:hypothetical protein [Streptomyces sp. NPDC019539]|uniref:hypothetical protein n=1 Tax=Streptomyces sp. NPDC019539 TaxID=3365063 RepID=UPI00379E2B3D